MSVDKWQKKKAHNYSMYYENKADGSSPSLVSVEKLYSDIVGWGIKGGRCYSTAWLRQAEAERGWGSWRALAWHVLSGEHNKQQAWCRSCGCSHLRNFELQCNARHPEMGPLHGSWLGICTYHWHSHFMLSSIGVSSWCHVSRLRLKMKDKITALWGGRLCSRSSEDAKRVCA